MNLTKTVTLKPIESAKRHSDVPVYGFVDGQFAGVHFYYSGSRLWLTHVLHTKQTITHYLDMDDLNFT